MTQPTICLNMIVKDEAHVIKDTLDNLCSYFDFSYWVICDTGSTDGTQDIVRDFFGEKGISGELLEHEWRDFGHNRSLALIAAYKKTDYLLVFDADDRIVGDFKLPTEMTADSYYLKIGKEFSYKRTLIVNNRKKWRFKGVLHEYICCVEPVSQCVDIEGNYYMDSRRSGSRNKDPLKYAKDAEALDKAYAKETDEGLRNRYVFYCAQSYKDAGNIGKAIEWYKKVLELNTWDQEKYISYLKLGECFKQIGDECNMIYYWTKGYSFMPSRAETLYELINYYRNKGEHKLCKMYYDVAKNICNPGTNALFVSNDVYSYKLLLEYTIFSYYLGNKNINDETVAIFNNTYDVNNLLHNMKFYNYKLESKQIVDLSFKLKKEYNGIIHDFNSSSSCLQLNETGDGYSLYVRMVSYFIDDKNNYIHNKNIVSLCKKLELDISFNIMSEKLYEINFENKQNVGVDDVRVYKDPYTNKTMFICNRYNSSNKIGMYHGILNADDCNIENQLTTQIIPEFNPSSQCEKNWAYVDYKNETHIIYSWHPLKICKIKPNNPSLLEFVCDKPTPSLFSRARGSSIGFSYNDEIWFIAHIVSYEVPRHYYHVIAVFDEELNLKRYSAPFKFENAPIEYCMGLIVTSENVIMSFSTWDRTTKIGIYDMQYIETDVLKYKFNTSVINTSVITNKNSIPLKIVNLERRLDRKNKMINELKKWNITDYEFINAVDGKNMKLNKELFELFKNNNFFYRQGVIGCALSHYNLWKKLINDDTTEFYLIAEDDITLAYNFKYIVKRWMNNSSKNDITFFGYSSLNPDNDLNREHKYTPLNHASYVGGFFCYGITKNGARKLVDYINTNGIKQGIDCIPLLVKNMTLCEISPHIVFTKWKDPTKNEMVDTDIQISGNACVEADIDIINEFEFIKNVDQRGNDLYVIKNTSVDYKMYLSLQQEEFAGFNTLGYFKNKIEDLSETPYFGENDGIYIKLPNNTTGNSTTR